MGFCNCHGGCACTSRLLFERSTITTIVGGADQRTDCFIETGVGRGQVVEIGSEGDERAERRAN